MDDKFIHSCHPFRKDLRGPKIRAGIVPWHKTGKALTACGFNSRGWQEGTRIVVCPGIKGCGQEE